MSKQRFYIGVIVVLVLVNIFFLFSINHRNDHHRRGGPRNIIIESLSLDDKQIDLYDDLIHEHRDLLKERLYDINLLRQSYFNGHDSLLVPLSDSMSLLERTNKQHINDIMEICTDSQKKEFKDLINEQSLFSPPPPELRPPNRHPKH